MIDLSLLSLPPVLETLRSECCAAVLSTDLVSPEPLIAQLAGNPRSDRETPYVLIRANYVPPYERAFPLIVQTERAIAHAKGFTPSYNGLVVLDVTDWIGHLDEDYFQLLLKYWSDQIGFMGWPAFLLRDAPAEAVSLLERCCDRYLPAQSFALSLFEDRKRLAGLLEVNLHLRGHGSLRGGAEILAQLLAAPELRKERTLHLLDRVLADLTRDMPLGAAITYSRLCAWTEREDCLLTRLAGRPLQPVDLNKEDRDYVRLQKRVS